MRHHITKPAVIATTAATVLLSVLVSPAQAASWSSYLSGAAPGFESRRWYEASASVGTTIQFTGCSDDYNNRAVGVTLWKAIDWAPDNVYSTAAFSNCFTGTSAESKGNWGDHGEGNFYFSVNNDAFDVHVSVRSLTVSY